MKDNLSSTQRIVKVYVILFIVFVAVEYDLDV